MIDRSSTRARLGRLGNRGHTIVLGVVSALLCACAIYRLPPVSPHNAELPVRLSATGLYPDATTTRLADDVRPYVPSYELWSDGAEKRRWIRIPAGTRIDTSDMDAWDFPVGTRLWKEFTRDGRRVETRLFARVGTEVDGWAAVAYVWNAEQTEAIASHSGVHDALGTSHDVPAARACMTCHGGHSSAVLGFSAVQLAHAPSSAHELTLARLVAEDLVTSAPTTPIAISDNEIEADALGWLHANCGSCHDAGRPDHRPWYRPRSDLDLWSNVEPAESMVFGRFVRPGSPSDSAIYRRAAPTRHCRRRMPPIATETIDRAGLAALARWISAMPERRSRE